MNKLFVAVAAIVSTMAALLASRSQTFRQVDAGGPILRMLQEGRGNPAVVLEAGAGGPLESWVRVQPAVGQFTTVISYDRAGNGLSENGATPRDGLQIATELHAALHGANVPPPYLLVGHSLGGPFIRVFAGIYPEEVAGMVLVDPTQEELVDWAKSHRPERHRDRPFRPYDEVDCAPLTFTQATDSRMPPGIPVVLISGMGPREIPSFLTAKFRDEVNRDQETFYPAKLGFYRKWLDAIPGGQLMITENSGHGIPIEEPELIVKTIRDMVNRWRASNP